MRNAVPRVAGLLGLVAALWVNSAMGQMIRFRSNDAPDNSTSVAAVADNGSTPFVPEKANGAVRRGDGRRERRLLRLRELRGLRLWLRQGRLR